jgi:predicted 2-oxoglutarate/Fe(II)-dependent dioxygenase YbiX
MTSSVLLHPAELFIPREVEARDAALSSAVLRDFTPRTFTSSVGGAGSQRYVDPTHRRSKSFILPESAFPLLAAISATLPYLRLFELTLLRYDPGDFFKPHFDAVTQTPSTLKRAVTAVLCLQAPSAGGELLFPNVNMAFPCRLHHAVVWANLDVRGQPNAASLHASAEVTAGRKIVAVGWFGPPDA